MTPLENYLRYYDTLTGPEYAVLVTGEWGIGKTHQVRDVLKRIDAERCGKDPLNPADYAYVSLFGASSPEQIDVEVLAAISPQASALSWLVRNAKEIASALPSKAASVGLASLMAGPIMRNTIAGAAHRTLVFDDLERSALHPKALLGVINRYVEHLKFRVVVIAHDDKLFEEFIEAKEKIFGQTIKVFADTESAWPAFVNALNAPEKRAFIHKHKDALLNSFAQSDVKSLRILRHVTEDIGRLYEVLNDQLRANDNGCSALVAWFALTDALVRTGDFKRDMLHHAASYSIKLFQRREKENYKPNNTEEAISKILHDSYKINFNDSEDAVSMLFDGDFRVKEILFALESSSIFFTPGSQPSWWKAWHYFDMDSLGFFQALDDMEEKFVKRVYEKREEVFHVFALRLRFAEDKILSRKSILDVENECASYVDELAARGCIVEDARADRYTIDSLTGAYGLGYSVGDRGPIRESFEKLIAHYRNTIEGVNENGLARKAAVLLDKLPSSPEEFVELLSTESYAQFPVFKSIDPRAFVAKILETPAGHWRTIERAIISRAENNHDIMKAESGTFAAIYINIDQSYQRHIKSADRIEIFKGARIRWFLGGRLREQVANYREKITTTSSAGRMKYRQKSSSRNKKQI